MIWSVFTLGLSSILWGILVSALLMGVLLFVLVLLSPGSVRTTIFYITGVILFPLLTFQTTLLVGAYKASGYVQDARTYLVRVAESASDGVEAVCDTDFVESAGSQFPMLQPFLKDVTALTDNGQETVQGFTDELQSAIDSYILRRYLWAGGFVLVACLLVLLIRPDRTVPMRRGVRTDAPPHRSVSHTRRHRRS